MKTLTLHSSFNAFFEPQNESEISRISAIVYSDTEDKVLKLKRYVFNGFDSIVNHINRIVGKKSANTVFWLSDHYEQNIIYSKNCRVFRELTLTNLVKDGKYLEAVSALKPKYMILNISGSDFLMPERINFMIQQMSNGNIEKTEIFDIVTIVLKKCLQKLYYSVRSVNAATTPRHATSASRRIVTN